MLFSFPFFYIWATFDLNLPSFKISFEVLWSLLVCLLNKNLTTVKTKLFTVLLISFTPVVNGCNFEMTQATFICAGT